MYVSLLEGIENYLKCITREGAEPLYFNASVSATGLHPSMPLIARHSVVVSAVTHSIVVFLLEVMNLAFV